MLRPQNRQNARKYLKRLVRIGLHRFGGLSVLRRHNRKKFRILMYHRFSSVLYPGAQDALSEQCAYLKRWYYPSSLTDICEHLLCRRQMPPGAVAITVDDGYRDFLTDAFPVFQHWKIPVTVFLVTDFVDGELWQWWDRVDYAIMTPRAGPFSWQLRVLLCGNIRSITWSSAIEVICAQLVSIPNRTRLDS